MLMENGTQDLWVFLTPVLQKQTICSSVLGLQKGKCDIMLYWQTYNFQSQGDLIRYYLKFCFQFWMSHFKDSDKLEQVERRIIKGSKTILGKVIEGTGYV